MKKDIYQIKGKNIDLSWGQNSGEVEQYQLQMTDRNGSVTAMELLSGDTTSFTLPLDKPGDYTVSLTAIPKGGSSRQQAEKVQASIQIHSLSFIESYWVMLAGAGVILAAVLLVIVLVLKRR